MPGITVWLTGGPSTMTEEDRIQEVPNLTDKVKVLRGNAHEHFMHTGQSRELHGTVFPVFGWCDRTKLAE